MLSKEEKQNIQLVWDGMGAILETKDKAVVDASFAKDFIQHNPWAKDGIEHIHEMLQFNFGYKPIRWVADADIMAYHGYYTAPNPLGEYPLLCVDAWRIEDGKIQEHWDALAPMPEELLQQAIAGNGNGEKETSLEKRVRNKATVRRFLDRVCNRGQVEEIDRLLAEDYVYHHPSKGTLSGKASLQQLLEQEGGRMPHDNKLLLASGDLVMAHSHFFGSNERVVFDWFRLDESGQVAEHWSVEQAMTPWEEVANDHPHF
ncbi:MAG: nuclear transport factor 2 family protein [Bacteroidota bacterium]